MHSLRAVLFDVGGVLLLLDPSAARRLLAPYGAEPDDHTCRKAHDEAFAVLDTIRRPDWTSINTAYAKASGVTDELAGEAAKAVERLYRQERSVILPGAGSALKQVAGLGARLGVVSNAHGTIEAQLRDAG